METNTQYIDAQNDSQQKLKDNSVTALEQALEQEKQSNGNPAKQQQESLILDFSQMFKAKTGNFNKKPKAKQTVTPNWLLQIPAKLSISLADIQRRRLLNIRKWECVIKTSSNGIYQKLIASVCSAWNYLHSVKGIGKQPVLDFKQLNDKIIKYCSKSQFTEKQGYPTLQIIDMILQFLNSQTNGKKLIQKTICKLSQPNRIHLDKEQQRKTLIQNLQNQLQPSFHIYLTYNDLYLPIGYEITPLSQLQAYSKLQQIEQSKREYWIISSSTVKADPSFSIKRWADIQKDLSTVWPYYFDIKNVKQGVKLRPDANEENSDQKEGTSSCIIEIKFSNN